MSALINDFGETGHLSPQRMSKRLHLSLVDFSRLVRLDRNTLARPESPTVQARLEPIAQILGKAEVLAGDANRAIVWFRHQPLPGHDGRTARALVEADASQAVLGYLEDLLDGAYA